MNYDCSSVGIIANPLAGKDIRRLVANASVVSNQSKSNDLVKIYSGLVSTGVKKVLVMPDLSNLTRRAHEKFFEEIKTEFTSSVILDQEETALKAAEEMEARKVSCVIILGGDGTCRLASKMLKKHPFCPYLLELIMCFQIKLKVLLQVLLQGSFV